LNKTVYNWFLFNLKMGCLSFGGSGRLLLYQEEVVDKRQWLSAEEVNELLTLGQTLPGPNLINLAHLIGQRLFGFWGSVMGLAALVVPGTFVALFVYTLIPLSHYSVRVLFQGFTLASLFVFLIFVKKYFQGIVVTTPRGSKSQLWAKYALAVVTAILSLSGYSVVPILIGGGVIALSIEFVFFRRKSEKHVS
jgi:chromate transport protein ChrA